MPRLSGFRRLAAALSGALLLQLSLLGSGTLCAMEHGSDAHGSGHAAMRMAGPTSEHGAPQGHDAPRCDVAGSDDGCGLPWAPGHCAAMTTCSATAAPVSAVSIQLAAATPAADMPEPTLIHSGPAAAPELPPPRA